MNPLRERDLMLTRRQLFGRAVGGIGTAALASLLAPAAFAAKGLPGFPNFPPEGEARHLSAPIGRALADGPVRSQAEARRTLRRGAARFHPPGPAPHRHDFRAEEVSGGAVHLQVRAATARAARG